MHPSALPVPVARVLCHALMMAGLAMPLSSLASPAGDALRRLQGDGWITRDTTLLDLGVKDPVVLSNSDARQEFYLPVPRGVPISDATLTFDARYAKGEAGRTTLVLWLDGVPQTAERIADGDGSVTRSLNVDNRNRESGFLRLGVDWQSEIALRHCESNRATANALVISPQTHLSYRYDASAIGNLDDAWGTLPGKPVLMVAGAKLDQQAFDSAWRLGVALERSGKRVAVRAFPSVGDEVDTRGLQAPAGLEQVAAFAAVANKPAHKLAGPAEIGALLVLGAPAVSGDVVIADAALRGRYNEALDALAAQLAGDTDAAAAFKTWRQARMPLAGTDLPSGDIRLLPLGRQAVIAVAADAGAQAAGAFDSAWRRILVTRQVNVKTATSPQASDDGAVRLTTLGGSATSFDVVARGDWTTTFPLGTVSSDGLMPDELVLDLAAAPGASSTRPVASVFWNGILLAARQMDADGKPERLTARVPGYALGVTNALRVQFQRQPVSVDCNEIPQGYPVNVLPTSYVKPGKPQPDGTFVGLLPLMAGNPQVIIPDSYLADAPDNIKRVIGIASASGVSPTRAELSVAPAGQPFKPARAFLAMEVPVDGAKPMVQVTDRKQLKVDGRNASWLDISGLDHLSTAEVVRGNGQDGVLWHTVGQHPGMLDAPFVLNRGNVAVVGVNGPIAWIDSANPQASNPAGPGGSAFFEWRRYIAWSVPAISVALLVLILILIVARRVGRKKNRGNP
ncbi:cellulose biosynthesis cyclic di-GMP-binding regulatory protein BcsB [Achromobacter sp. ES-001]|uniref:cellulose biosynthesis cyclic di-GMP-binding regulatory protein BcsB n=1 Tax=Achromobacter sp. ES-001 TaxID=2860286 RepID=UPI001C642C5B|nr:cellulose biosynthesis cyclic di-GMP-binding regulatory protein BcsB [Achromobacter sp. ES-001]QYJ23023.1 cellulose biosynthesis cyclic di-GMP-binding regulatory protein BcsB [Achromobacter sp. ES-001]